MKTYLKDKISYYKYKIPIVKESLKHKEKWNYDISMEKLFKMKANLHECERQLKELNKVKMTATKFFIKYKINNPISSISQAAEAYAEFKKK